MCSVSSEEGLVFFDPCERGKGRREEEVRTRVDNEEGKERDKTNLAHLKMEIRQTRERGVSSSGGWRKRERETRRERKREK